MKQVRSNPDSSRSVAVDSKAPVRGAAAIEIAGPLSDVWDVLTDISGWPKWNPNVQAAQMEGPLAVGTIFRWKSGTSLVSRIIHVDQGRMIAWTGWTTGIRAIHIYRFQSSGSITKVVTEESFQGLIVRLLRGSMQRTLDTALKTGLESLKQETERKRRPG
jgi:hypothetical protein